MSLPPENKYISFEMPLLSSVSCVVYPLIKKSCSLVGITSTGCQPKPLGCYDLQEVRQYVAFGILIVLPLCELLVLRVGYEKLRDTFQADPDYLDFRNHSGAKK